MMRGDIVSPNIRIDILREELREGIEPDENSPILMKRIHGEEERDGMWNRGVIPRNVTKLF